MSSLNRRWILAFDASCGVCRAISEKVTQACDGKLEVLPLSNAQVEQWREQALGPQAPAKPTLLSVTEQGTQVRAWTGATMGLWLMRRLGLRSTMRVLAALEQLRRGEEEQVERRGIGRARFLRLCAGGAVVAGMILMGKRPAFATGESQALAKAQAWVEANKARLPTNYDDLIAYPMPYRRAIYRASAPQVRAQFWQEQFKRYRAAHPALSTEQEAALDRFLHLTNTDLTALTEADAQAAINAFGKDEALATFATLGPGSAPTLAPARTADESCECSVGHDWCSGNTSCHRGGCTVTGGCGIAWAYDCDGLCS